MPSRWRVLAGQALQAPRDVDARRALTLSLRRMARTRSAPPFQPYNDTGPDRYPEIFDHFAGDRAGLTVVSLGSSVGDELITLRRYFPAARIVGVEASRGNVVESRRRIEQAALVDIDVRRGTDLRLFADESVDIVFAMAVFRHGALSSDHPQTCRPHLRFADFDASIADLVRALRVGGTLVVEHSNFRVLDTSSSGRLECVLDRPAGEVDGTSPCYGPDDRLCSSPTVRAVAFRRTG